MKWNPPDPARYNPTVVEERRRQRTLAARTAAVLEAEGVPGARSVAGAIFFLAEEELGTAEDEHYEDCPILAVEVVDALVASGRDLTAASRAVGQLMGMTTEYVLDFYDFMHDEPHIGDAEIFVELPEGAPLSTPEERLRALQEQLRRTPPGPSRQA